MGFSKGERPLGRCADATDRPASAFASSSASGSGFFISAVQPLIASPDNFTGASVASAKSATHWQRPERRLSFMSRWK
jgi:hypothetical protein